MQLIQTGRRNCAQTRKYLDYYISNELSIEASLDLENHLGTCYPCTQEFLVRMRLKGRLREAVKRQAAPRDLRTQLMTRLKSRP